jgi:hypothetical protein
MKEKWKNWWWYHWWHVLIAVAVIAVVLYSILPGMMKPKPDYGVAVISVYGLPDETLASLQERIQREADDANRDNRILIQMNLYRADLSGETDGTINYSEAARLDADLVGNVSSIFLIDDPDGFQQNAVIPTEPGALCESLPFFDGIALPEGMVFTIRSDSASQAVFDLYERILSDR